jgi:DNA-binding XRE family transcriptional regulator
MVTKQDPIEADQPKHPGGRPLKFETVAELDRAIQNYFAKQDPHETQMLVETGRDSKGNLLYDTRNVLTEQKPYTMSGLARELGISRQTLLNYSERDEYLDSIRDAKQRCEEYAESLLFSQFSNGAKFALINNYQGKHQDWSDKSAVDHTSDGERLAVAPIIISEVAARKPDASAQAEAA